MNKITNANSKSILIGLSFVLFASFAVISVFQYTNATTEITNEIQSDPNELDPQIETKSTDIVEQSQLPSNQTQENTQIEVNQTGEQGPSFVNQTGEVLQQINPFN